MNLRLIATTGALVLVTGALAFLFKPKPAEVPFSEKLAPYKGSIIRVLQEGKFCCTGFVISPTQAITANHCVVKTKVVQTMFGPMPVEDGAFKTLDVLVNGIKQKTKVIGSPRGYYDASILEGKFDNVKPFEVILPNDTIKTAQACGYPMGVNGLLCFPQRDVSVKHSYVFAFGGLFKGMSGGPLFALEKGRLVVIGINTAINPQTDVNMFTPILSIKDLFYAPKSAKK